MARTPAVAMMLALATLVVLGLLTRQPVNGTALLVVGAVFGAMAWWAYRGGRGAGDGGAPGYSLLGSDFG